MTNSVTGAVVSIDIGETFTNDAENIGIWQRFKFELSEGFFSLKEPSGRYIDVSNSFAPDSPQFQHVLLLRIAFFIWSVVTFGVDISSLREEEGHIYLGFLTRQGITISVLYQLVACVVTFYRKSLIQPNIDSKYEPSGLVKTMWFLYFLSVPLEILITSLYWTLDYPTKDGSIKYDSVYTHGILLILLLIDGYLIARIPLKIKQVLAIESYVVFYLIWTIIHAFSGIGDGNNESGEDLLYDVVDWKGNPIKTTITFFIVLLVLTPIFFLLTWLLSFAGPGCTCKGGRRQLHDGSNSHNV